MDIKIRPYTTQDTQDILDIINYNILNTTTIYDYNPRTLETQTSILNDKLKKGFPIIVATDNDKFVGFGLYGEFRLREANKFTVEHSIYVHPKATGKGIGKLLMQALIDLAKQQNIHTMIGVIDAENKSSIIFHEKMGFKNAGIIKESAYKFNRWLDSVFMQLIF